MTRALCLLPLLLLACGDKSSSDDDDDGGTSDDTAGEGDDSGGEVTECEGAAPVVDTLSCSNSGMEDYNGTPTPTFYFKADVTDADGDLESHSIEIYYDSEVDGVLDPSSATLLGTTEGTVGGVECEAGSTQARTTYYLQGTPTWGETYDFGMVVVDRHGLSSEASVRTCRMPDENGIGGGPV